ncbi:hypothetical protein [Brevundimonas guildfordensis]|jgi:hypothetical protein|uniref:Uncharacterized protein n=1 Tax=Brevundimonas guildfordensis TaxID=2762241 RepID=A0ABR8QYD9_9CAUL|nr:hypothetical protein [Brevundimonas guildfordensis]MBD7940547.1 hypothetical protein [Brevundimonas guildfordensis]
MLLGVVLAWAIAAMQDAPRFTLTPEFGDALAAEVFRLDPDRAEEQVRALLGDASDDAAGDGGKAAPEVQGAVLIQSAGLLSVAYRDGSLPDGPLILFAGPDAEHAPDAACRLTRRPEGMVDNSERATEWCLGFVLKVAPTLVIPPAPVS